MADAIAAIILNPISLGNNTPDLDKTNLQYNIVIRPTITLMPMPIKPDSKAFIDHVSFLSASIKMPKMRKNIAESNAPLPKPRSISIVVSTPSFFSCFILSKLCSHRHKKVGCHPCKSVGIAKRLYVRTDRQPT